MNSNHTSNSLTGLLQILRKWKIRLITAVAVTAVLSFVFSSPWIVRPRFTSTAVIYAPRTNSTAKILLNEESYNEKLDIRAYASEEETEQMMQLLDAREIKDSLIEKYDLFRYYDIKPDRKAARAKLYKAIGENITIRRTDYGAISVSVTDWNPQYACEMANDVLRLLDTIKNRTEHERASSAYALLGRQIDSARTVLKKINDTLQSCMAHGVFDFASQSERLMQQYAIAVAQGNRDAVNRLEKEKQKLSAWGPKSLTYCEMQKLCIGFLDFCKRKQMSAQMDMNGSMPVKFIVEKPIVPDKKSSPKRLVIMLVSSLCVLIVSVIVILSVEDSGKKTAADPEADSRNPEQ